ncbi:SMI1/KNR4 family protein [Epilithonimonas xixisoli]|nr:SMI1/KNR4 family protein [Epilithonimonas xixisoli]
MKIKPTDEIKKNLLSNIQPIRNFPKAIDFPFDKLYVEITTQIRTTEISSECILFDSVEAVNQTKEFSDKEYWKENYTQDEIAKFCIFGQNGQGDLWLFDIENKIYFYDHDKEEMCRENFIELDLNFEKWLVFADLNKQLDEIYGKENEINEKQKAEYKENLAELSSVLLSKYPFNI